MTSQHSIVVGLDGSRAAWQALDWAGDEARRTERSLLVAHVARLAGRFESHDGADGDVDLLARADAVLAERYPEVHATTALLAGEPAEVLVELAQRADLLVLGRAHRGLSHRLLGIVANRALAHAECPTVIVPDGRSPAPNVIAVGVSTSEGGAAALRFAFAEAARRGAEVVAVRSWSLHEWRLASEALPLSSPEVWETQERTILDDCLRPVRDAYPTVPCRTVLTTLPTEVALRREGEIDAMLVLGCRRSAGGLLPRLGPLSSWAVHQFDCPVVIVGSPGDYDEHHHHTTASDVARLPVPYLGDGT